MGRYRQLRVFVYLVLPDRFLDPKGVLRMNDQTNINQAILELNQTKVIDELLQHDAKQAKV